ncbi:glycoside hydrolase [Treponema zuelzerae]|uniref:Glycoside hydrolase n=1 Tax=Teretinema zuelzerae TaxID=156 RepID=A0AAE3JIP2_9SPIR|nr:glycosyl hydrolase family 18 protein [Teretinema zuelzerae]MCD1655437.1 glycoside hydrolase [Teretinema zuelzerae]
MNTAASAYRKILFILLAALSVPFFADVSPEREDRKWPKAGFSEIWGYVYDVEAPSFSAPPAVSDIGFFGAGLSLSGRLTGVPVRSAIKDFPGRVHLVVAEVTNRALTHLCLDPSLPLRSKLIADCVAAAKPYDGLQIDFEMVLPEDDEWFFSFLQELKRGIGKKTLSVAIPARTRKLSRDAYDYARLSLVADRVLVMAYDEHWSGSKPGPIATLEWGRKVSLWALERFGDEKLVMGLPFYGRAWADVNPAKAYRFSTLRSVMEEKSVSGVERLDGIPTFTYTQDVFVTVFFEDWLSAYSRARLYRDEGVKKIGFWKLGQEDPLVWDRLSLERPVRR